MVNWQTAYITVTLKRRDILKSPSHLHLAQTWAHNNTPQALQGMCNTHLEVIGPSTSAVWGPEESFNVTTIPFSLHKSLTHTYLNSDHTSMHTLSNSFQVSAGLNGISQSLWGVSRLYASLALALGSKHIKVHHAKTNCGFWYDCYKRYSEQFKMQSIAGDILKQWSWELCTVTAISTSDKINMHRKMGLEKYG